MKKLVFLTLIGLMLMWGCSEKNYPTKPCTDCGNDTLSIIDTIFLIDTLYIRDTIDPYCGWVIMCKNQGQENPKAVSPDKIQHFLDHGWIIGGCK